MADLVKSTTQSGQTWSSLVTTGSIPDVLRKKGVDEATRLTYLTKRWNSFTWMLHNNLRNSVVNVNDRVYITREIDELDRYYKVVIPSGQNINGINDVNHQWVGLPNSEAAQIQPQTVLYPKGLYATPVTRAQMAGIVSEKDDGTYEVNNTFEHEFVGDKVEDVLFSRVKGPYNDIYFVEEEQLLVVEKREKDSGGPGITMIKLERCYMGPGAKDKNGGIIPRQIVYGPNTGIRNNMTNGNKAAQIKAGDILLRAMPAYLEGTNYPDGVFKNPVSDTNFTQLFKYAVSQTLESDIPALWIKERPMDIYRWVTLLRMNRDREYANLLGRKGMDRDAEGKEIYLSGGVREFIPKDKDHYIIYPYSQLNWVGLLDMSIPLLNLNGSGTYWGITGPTLDIALRKAFYNENLIFNKEESKKFGMEVNSLMLAGIQINLIVSQIFEEAGYGNELMLLDMGEGMDSFQPVTHQGWDYRVDKDIAEPGSNIKKEGIQGMFGLRRRRATRHAIIDFNNAVPIK